jgi:hypothetical protein
MKKRVRLSAKEVEYRKLDETAAMLDNFSNFLVGIEKYRKAPKYSKELIQKVFKSWASSITKDEKQKHQAGLIKGFAEFLG